VPRVPTYDQFTVQPSDAALPRFNAPDMPVTAGKAALAAGEGMMQAGGALSAIAQNAQREADQLRVIDSTNQAVKAQMYLTYDQKDGFLNLKGENALKRPDGKPLDIEYTEKFENQLAIIEEKLGNDNQKKMFRVATAGLTRQFIGSINAHVGAEYKEFQTATFNGTIDVSTQKMTLNWGDPNIVAEQQNLIKSAVAARDKDLPEEQRQANLVKALSPGNSAVVSSAIDAGNVLYAKEYLLQNAQYITPENRLVLSKAVEMGNFEERTQTLAEQIYTEAKGDKTKALEIARTKLSGKEEDKTIERLKVRFAEDNEVDPKQVQAQSEKYIAASNGNVKVALELARKELEGKLEDTVVAKISAMDAENTAVREREQKAAKEAGWNAYNQTGSFSKIPKTVLAAMDPTDQAMLKEHAENRIYNQTIRGQAAEERKQRELYRKAAPEYLALANDPDKLEKMTATDIIALSPRLGIQHTEALLKRREQLENREGKLTAKMDNDQFNAIANEYGLEPFAKNKTKSQKEVLGLVKSRVDALLEQAAKEKRGPLTKDEKADIVRNAMKQEVEIDGLIWNDRKPALTITPKEAEKVVVPAAERASIIEALRQAYKKNPSAEYEPNEANIRRLYIRGLQK